MQLNIVFVEHCNENSKEYNFIILKSISEERSSLLTIQSEVLFLSSAESRIQIFGRLLQVQPSYKKSLNESALCVACSPVWICTCIHPEVS